MFFSTARTLGSGPLQWRRGKGRTPEVSRSIRVLLGNPRWEKHFLKFLELSGVGRTVADGTDVEETRAARMDTWIVWEAEERVA